MKKLILFVVLAVAAITTQAQEFSPANPTTKTVIGQDSITIEGTVFQVYITSNGAIKLERTSKSGNTYYQYLGYIYDATTMINGKEYQVYSNKAQTTFWYLVIGRTGFPSKRTLVKNG